MTYECYTYRYSYLFCLLLGIEALRMSNLLLSVVCPIYSFYILCRLHSILLFIISSFLLSQPPPTLTGLSYSNSGFPSYPNRHTYRQLSRKVRLPRWCASGIPVPYTSVQILYLRGSSRSRLNSISPSLILRTPVSPSPRPRTTIVTT